MMITSIKHYLDLGQIDYSRVIGYYSSEDPVICDLDDIPYGGSRMYLILKCDCGDIYKKRIDRLTNYCPKCGYYLGGQVNRVDWISRINFTLSKYDFELIGDLPENLIWDTQILLKSKSCGHEFKRRLDRLDSGCPICNKINSHGVNAYHSGDILTTHYGVQHYMSLLELNFIKAMDSCNLISEFQMQPLTHVIPYIDQGILHKYYPDAILVYNQRRYLIEIKPTGFMLDDHITQLKIDAALIYCDKNNLIYSVITDDEISDDIDESIKLILDRFSEENQVKNLKERNLI